MLKMRSAARTATGQAQTQNDPDALLLPAYLSDSTILSFSERTAGGGSSVLSIKGTGVLRSERVHGCHYDTLIDRGLTPQLGDCLMSINDIT